MSTYISIIIIVIWSIYIVLSYCTSHCFVISEHLQYLCSHCHSHCKKKSLTRCVHSYIYIVKYKLRLRGRSRYTYAYVTHQQSYLAIPITQHITEDVNMHMKNTLIRQSNVEKHKYNYTVGLITFRKYKFLWILKILKIFIEGYGQHVKLFSACSYHMTTRCVINLSTLQWFKATTFTYRDILRLLLERHSRVERNLTITMIVLLWQSNIETKSDHTIIEPHWTSLLAEIFFW